MESGVARRPIEDFAQYRRELERFVFRTGYLMRPIFEAARQSPVRVAYAEGEDERTLRAVQTVLDEGIAEPVLIGRREVRSEEHTSELQSRQYLVCRLLLEKKKTTQNNQIS